LWKKFFEENKFDIFINRAKILGRKFSPHFPNQYSTPAPNMIFIASNVVRYKILVFVFASNNL
jgi:hypothetical protein